MTLTEAREAFAAALDALDGYTVTTRPSSSMHPGSGWVEVGDLTPGEFFGSGHVVLTGVLVLSPSEQQAEAEFERIALPALRSLRDLPVFGIKVSPELYLTRAANAALCVATVTATMEVS